MKHELELKGTKEELNSAIALFVNSGYQVHWEARKSGNVKRKVLVVTKRVNGKTRKFDGCSNKSRKCNCQHRRRYE